MLRNFMLVFASFVCLPLTSVAAVIDIEYSGHVIWLGGSGFGHQLGDNISGAVQIDTAKSWGDVLPEADKARYSSIDPALVTSSLADLGSGYPVDSIEIYNGSHVDYYGALEDYVAILDGNVSSDSTGASLFKSLQLYFIFQGTDWLTSDSIDNLNINSSDPVFMGPSFGVLLFSESTQTNEVGFKLDSVNIRPATVSESGSLMLLVMGMLGLLIRRKSR